MKITTRRATIRRRLDAIAVKRLLFCAACKGRIDPATEPGLPCRDGAGNAWHRHCWDALDAARPRVGARGTASDLYDGE